MVGAVGDYMVFVKWLEFIIEACFIKGSKVVVFCFRRAKEGVVMAGRGLVDFCSWCHSKL